MYVHAVLPRHAMRTHGRGPVLVRLPLFHLLDLNLAVRVPAVLSRALIWPVRPVRPVRPFTPCHVVGLAQLGELPQEMIRLLAALLHVVETSLLH